MLCVPTVSTLVEQAAVFELADPDGSGRALQPAIVAPSAANATEPPGAAPLTVAVKVMFAPALDGFGELVRVVVLGPAVPSASATASMNVVLSLESVPAKAITCVPGVAMVRGMLYAAKEVVAGETKAPI